MLHVLLDDSDDDPDEMFHVTRRGRVELLRPQQPRRESMCEDDIVVVAGDSVSRGDHKTARETIAQARREEARSCAARVLVKGNLARFAAAAGEFDGTHKQDTGMRDTTWADLVNGAASVPALESSEGGAFDRCFLQRAGQCFTRG